MNFWIIAGGISFILLICFFFFFSLYSLLEKEKKAFWRGVIFLFFLLLTGIVFMFVEIPLRIWLFEGFFILFVVSILFFMISFLRKKTIKIVGEQKKIDERDVIFSRFDYREGTGIFKEYYARRPEYKKIDDEIRKFPDLHSSYHIKKNPWLFSLAAAEFDFLAHQLKSVSGKKDKDKIEFSPVENSRMIKSIIKYLGSDLCGICVINQAYVYSYVGRGPEPYGKEIELKHKYAIAFALEMDLKMVASAPDTPVIVETGKKYVEAAKISIIVADLIRRLGYSARAHVAGSNYQTMLPPIAWEAGLGELGRLGILITSKYGPRARLGLITTDIPLVVDTPKTLGIQNYCQKCQKCARNCPSQAISYREKVEENGVLKWVLDREKCYKYWRKVGTDCSVCIYVCPYRKPANVFHHFVRKMTEISYSIQSVSIWGDDIFYGRFPQRKKSTFDI